MADNTQRQLQELSDEYQKIQSELQTIVSARQRLEAQEKENQGVQKEFQLLTADENIYKLIGPVLLKQDHAEAKLAVEGRLDFIGKEIKRTEESIQQLQQQAEQKRTEIMQMQSQAAPAS